MMIRELHTFCAVVDSGLAVVMAFVCLRGYSQGRVKLGRPPTLTVGAMTAMAGFLFLIFGGLWL